MQFIDLKAQYATIENEIQAAIQKVLQHGSYILGPEVRELENQLGAYVGRKHAIACANGTDALLIPLLAQGVGPGDAVFTPSFTFFATAEVVALCGATPVFVDIDPATYVMDPADLEKQIARVTAAGQLRPRAIIPVDLFGQCADYEAIEAIAGNHGLWVLEDAAQGFGGQYNGRRAGRFGLIAATSFFPAKPLGCYGDGGMLFTDDDALAERCRSVAIHGKGTDKYDNVRIGLNSRLDSIQAAILLEKFRIFPAEIERRQKVAAAYGEALRGIVATPVVAPGNLSVWAQYCVRHPERRLLMERLQAAGIPSAIYYPIPLHRSTAFSRLGYAAGSLPVTEAVAADIFALPMHPYLAQASIAQIAAVLRAG